MEIESVIQAFGLKSEPAIIGSGHINQTYLVHQSNGRKAILQKLNTQVFRNPEFVMDNLQIVLDHLKASEYPYEVLEIIPTISGKPYILENSSCWRLLSFIDGIEALVNTGTPGLSGIVAEGYGNFLKSLYTLDPSKLKDVIPDFHNPEQRFQQLLIACETASKERIEKAQSLIDHALALSSLTSAYAKCISEVPSRVTHGDAKASNILLNSSGNQIIGIIDLDTVMPGYLMNDVGDMVRSMCNTGIEDDRDTSRVSLDPEIFYQILYGFLDTLHELLTQEELDSLMAGIRSILYEQFIRFLSDYLNQDIYYQTNRMDQNLDRAKVHLKLLIDFQAREDFFVRIINQCLEQLDAKSK